MFQSAAMGQIAWVCRIVVGLTFVVSGFGKLRDLPAFVEGAVGYHVLRDGPTRRLAPLLPLAELALALLLLAGVAPPWAAIGSCLLLVTFAAAVGLNLRRGRAIPCFCFGSSREEPIGLATLLRIGVAAAFALAAFRAPQGLGPPLPPGASPDSLMWLLAMVASLTLFVFAIGPAHNLMADVLSVRATARLRRHQASDASPTLPRAAEFDHERGSAPSRRPETDRSLRTAAESQEALP